MAYEIYHAIDQWTEQFYLNKDTIIKDGRALLDEYQRPVGKQYTLGVEGKLRFEFTMFFHPSGLLEFSGVASINGSPFDIVRYHCLANYIESLNSMRIEDEVVVIIRTGKVQSAPPGLKMAETMDAIGKAVFAKQPQPRLHGGALEELMLIQQDFMAKEKDTKGLLELRESYFGLQQDDPSNGQG